jgi:hypothetical protein
MDLFKIYYIFSLFEYRDIHVILKIDPVARKHANNSGTKHKTMLIISWLSRCNILLFGSVSVLVQAGSDGE